VAPFLEHGVYIIYTHIKQENANMMMKQDSVTYQR